MKKKFKITWKNAVDFDYSISMDIQLLIVEWLFLSGWKYQTRSYPHSGVFEMLQNHGCVNCQYYGMVLPVFEKDELRKIISRAVLRNNVIKTCRQWRDDHNINYEGLRIIIASNDVDTEWYGMFDNDIMICAKLKKLKSFESKRLNYSPNEYHPKLNYIDSVQIRICEHGLSCLIEYGGDNSSWELKRYPRENKYILDWINEIILDLEKMTKQKIIGNIHDDKKAVN